MVSAPLNTFLWSKSMKSESNTYLDIRAFTAKGEARFNYMVLHAYGHQVEMMPNLLLRCQAACLKDMNVYLSQNVDLAWEVSIPGGEDVSQAKPESAKIWFKPESGDLIVQRCRFHEEHRNYPQEVEVL